MFRRRMNLHRRHRRQGRDSTKKIISVCWISSWLTASPHCFYSGYGVGRERVATPESFWQPTIKLCAGFKRPYRNSLVLAGGGIKKHGCYCAVRQTNWRPVGKNNIQAFASRLPEKLRFWRFIPRVVSVKVNIRELSQLMIGGQARDAFRAHGIKSRYTALLRRGLTVMAKPKSQEFHTRWHRHGGRVSVFHVLLLAVAGIALNRGRRLGLDRKNVTFPMILPESICGSKAGEPRASAAQYKLLTHTTNPCAD